MSNCVVTGSSGFIGSHICDELCLRGHNVLGIDDYSAGKLENVVHLKCLKCFRQIMANVSNYHDIVKAISGHFDNVDYIFHNAASKKVVCMKRPDVDLMSNAMGTLRMLQIAQDYGAKFIHASTGSVYGEPVIFPQRETHPLNPNSFYGVSKLAAERYVDVFNKTNGLRTTILRYFHVYGLRQDDTVSGVVSIFIRNKKENKPFTIYGDGSQERSFTWVKDIVNANMLAMEDKSTDGEVYNCASGLCVTIRQLAKIIDKDRHINYLDELSGDPHRFQVENAKIKSKGLTFEKDLAGRIRSMM